MGNRQDHLPLGSNPQKNVQLRPYLLPPSLKPAKMG